VLVKIQLYWDMTPCRLGSGRYVTCVSIPQGINI